VETFTQLKPLLKDPHYQTQKRGSLTNFNDDMIDGPQVEPDRFKHKYSAILDFEEALHVEIVRNTFSIQLYELLERIRGS